MSTKVKALLVLCEGPHDVAFIKKVLRVNKGYTKVNVKFSKLPAPFNSLFKQTVTSHALKDISLEMAHKFFLPDIILKNEDHYVFVFNSGGNTAYDKVRSLLEQYITLADDVNTFPSDAEEIVEKSNYLFLYDADELGVDEIATTVKYEFDNIDQSPFLNKEWKDSISSMSGKVMDNKALYVWGRDQEKGTLEDLIYPMFLNDKPEIISKAEEAIDGMFNWPTTISQQAKRKKAIITVAGQKKKPGLSMNLILSEGDLIKENTWQTDSRVIEFLSFFDEVI